MSDLHIEFQIEEPSMEAVLQLLAPKLFSGRATFRIINYQNKQRLLRELPIRLRGYASRLPRENLRLLVLVDRDDDDCRELKGRLESMAERAGLGTKTGIGSDGLFHVVNRIVAEELEAWFFGDPVAVRTAYPRVSSTFERRRPYREPDAIAGGTWEALRRLLREAGYLSEAYPKIQIARQIAGHLDPARNRSPSFRCFLAGLESLLLPGVR